MINCHMCTNEMPPSTTRDFAYGYQDCKNCGASVDQTKSRESVLNELIDLNGKPHNLPIEWWAEPEKGNVLCASLVISGERIAMVYEIAEPTRQDFYVTVQELTDAILLEAQIILSEHIQ